MRRHFWDSIKVGTNNDNVLTGDQGNDILVGKNGNDYLVSTSGNDLMSGGEGNDLIEDQGRMSSLTTMSGGYGDDVFKFHAFSGVDGITDYSAVYDAIDLSSIEFGWYDPFQSFSDLSITEQDGNTYIGVGPSVIVLMDYTASDGSGLAIIF